MTFEPGKKYYVLESSQWEEMLGMLADMELSYNLAQDFELAEDGRYYCPVDSGKIDDDEYSFMVDFGFMSLFDYKKSTQSTNPV